MMRGDAKETKKDKNPISQKIIKRGAINGMVCKNGKSMLLNSYTGEGGKQEVDVK